MTDRVHVVLGLTERIATAVEPHRADIADAVLALELSVTDHTDGSGASGSESAVLIDGDPVAITITRA